MPEMNSGENRDIQSREFIASAFSPTEDKIIVTLTGQPDRQLIMWNWDPHGNKDQELLTVIQIGQKGPLDNLQVKF